jgi:hypothetical protein
MIAEYSTKTSCDIFKSEVRGQNFMTPEVLGYFRPSKSHIAELSKGRGMEDNDIFGVTVISKNRITHQWVRNHEQSKCFRSRSAAMEHIEALALIV